MTDGNMEKDFDFGRVGTRMPYKVPEGFFGDLEANVMARVGNGSQGQVRLRRLGITGKVWWVVAAAAAVCVAVLVLKAFYPGHPSENDYMAGIESAYNGLTEEDQDFLLATYEDDLFINDDM